MAAGSKLAARIEERTRAFQNLDLWVAMFRLEQPASAMAPLLEAHMEFALGLEKKGVLFAAGPLLDEAGKPFGDGMFILRAVDRARAIRVARGDPMVKAGVRSVEVTAWRLNIGRLELKLDLSGGGARVG
jgi:uncharacterized protein YciI